MPRKNNKINIHLSGGFGNNLKQYITGCLIGNLKKKDVNIIKHYHPISNEDSMKAIYNIKRKNKDDKEIPINLSIVNPLVETLKGMYCPFKLSELYELRFFINENYLDWEKYPLPFELTNNDIVVSLRLGMNNEVVKTSPYLKEYPDGKRIPFSYYEEIIDKEMEIDNNKRIVICCDDFNNEFLSNFDKYPNIKLVRENTLIQFQVLRHAPFIISADSSFSHLAILFSNIQEQKGYVFYCAKNNLVTYIVEEFITSFPN